MDRRRPVLQALALVSALTVFGAVVVHAGCKNADPRPRAAAEPSAPPAMAAAAASVPSAAPPASTAPAESASAPAALPLPSRIHMGASKSGLVVRPSQAASNNSR